MRAADWTFAELRAEAEQKARDLRARMGLGDKLVPDPIGLLEDRGYLIAKRPLPNAVSGFFMRGIRGRDLIVLNSDTTLSHQH